MKKIISALLGLLILSGVLPFYASAVPQEMAAPVQEQNASVLRQKHYENSGPCYDFLNERLEISVFRQYLLENFAACTAEIDLKPFHLTFSNENQNTIARYIWKEMPEAFHVNTLQFYYWTSDMTITKIAVTYYNTPEEYAAMLAETDAVSEIMLEGLVGNGELTDAEKALILHDRLILRCAYDFDGYNFNRYDMYGALAEGLAVCEGYTKAYSYLLDQLGIKNYFCESRDLVHAWNIVYVDGLPYHVDVTWDDPDRSARVDHDNFLLSTNALIATGHAYRGTTDYDTSPVSTKYDRYFWQDSTAEIRLVENQIYFIDHESAELCKKVGECEKEILCSVEDRWMVDDLYYWSSNYSVLSSVCNSLLFSKADGVYVYHLKDGSVTKAFTPISENNSSVFSFSYENGVLSCEMRNSPDPAVSGAKTVRASYLPSPKDHVYDSVSDLLCNICGGLREGTEYLPGDLNGDLVVSSADAVYLLYYALLGGDRHPVNQNCDYNQDGSVTSADAIYLLYHVLLGSDRFPLNG